MKFKHTMEELKTKQALPLDMKILMAERRIFDFYSYFCGNVYIAFSGVKDSTVLLHLARRVFPDIPAVFVDTGLEYPEIRNFALSQENVTVLKPKMLFNKVVEEYGYPVVSKHISRRIADYRRNPDATWVKKAFNNEYSFNSHNIGKWGFLKDVPFLISDKCCDIIKKNPCKQYERETGRKPIIGTMTCEGVKRETAWLQNGCNSFNEGSEKSKPLSFWTEQDILSYLKQTNIMYSPIYGNIATNESGQLFTTGVNRTGCMFCMFGVQREIYPNRFQRMKQTHPKLYDYCINKLGCGEVLDYIEVDY